MTVAVARCCCRLCHSPDALVLKLSGAATCRGRPWGALIGSAVLAASLEKQDGFSCEEQPPERQEHGAQALCLDDEEKRLD